MTRAWAPWIAAASAICACTAVLGLDPTHLAPADAGAEASCDAVAASPYADVGDSSRWATFDATRVGPDAKGFLGGAFDGRYVYFASNDTSTVARLDTTKTLGDAASWTVFDMTTVPGATVGYDGAIFDGRYVYLVPYWSGGPHGVVARYDTQASFQAAASWSVFDVQAALPGAAGFVGATFDGKYLYLAPFENAKNTLDGVVARYDTKAVFGAPASWQAFDVTAKVSPKAKGFIGAVFDGRHVYFVPAKESLPYGMGGVVTRYDTQGSFSSAGSWETFDPTTLSGNALGFYGGVFDGRYVYLVPGYRTIAVRFDTQGDFADPASWGTFDTTPVNATARTFTGGGFDGRYVYFAGSGSGQVLRFDSLGDFADPCSWSGYDTTSTDPGPAGYFGAVFDGRFLYLVPNENGQQVPHGRVARFDARNPPSMPAVPASHGSFF